MSGRGMTVVSRFGTPDGLVVAAARRGLEGSEMRAAERLRAQGRGWQTIAQQLGCNVLDVRRALNDPNLDPAMVPAAPRASRAAAPLTLSDQILVTLAEDGPTPRSVLRQRLEGDARELDDALRRLRLRQKYVTPARGGWWLTPKGEAAAADAVARRDARRG